MSRNNGRILHKSLLLVTLLAATGISNLQAGEAEITLKAPAFDDIHKAPASSNITLKRGISNETPNSSPGKTRSEQASGRNTPQTPETKQSVNPPTTGERTGLILPAIQH